MISNKLPQGPITPRQYNTEFFDEWNRARGFVAGLNHAMQKTNDYEGAIHQLLCIGWPRCKETLEKALAIYKELVEDKVEGWSPRSDYRHVVPCKECTFCERMPADMKPGLCLHPQNGIHYAGPDGNEKHMLFKEIYDKEHFCAYGVKKVAPK